MVCKIYIYNRKHKTQMHGTRYLIRFLFLLHYLNKIFFPIAHFSLNPKSCMKNFRKHKELLHNKPSIRKVLGLKHFPSNSLLYEKMAIYCDNEIVCLNYILFLKIKNSPSQILIFSYSNTGQKTGSPNIDEEFLIINTFKVI